VSQSSSKPAHSKGAAARGDFVDADVIRQLVDRVEPGGSVSNSTVWLSVIGNVLLVAACTAWWLATH
jgi:hypothetical protein